MSVEWPTSTDLAVEAAGPVLERIAKPWGEELILGRSDASVVKMLRIRPGCRLSLQYHRRKHETLLLLSGTALLTVGDPGAHESRLAHEALVAGVRRHVPAGVVHRLTAGQVLAEILEVASRLPGDAEDIVRLADDYGRAGACASSGVPALHRAAVD